MNTDAWPRASLRDFPELREDPNVKTDCWGNFIVTAYAASILRDLHKISTKIDVPYVRDGKTWLRVRAWTPDGRTAEVEGEVFVTTEHANQAVAIQILQTKLVCEVTLKILEKQTH